MIDYSTINPKQKIIKN